jgi:L-seryl-tRNA(Ser) seleniumtransferase
MNKKNIMRQLPSVDSVLQRECQKRLASRFGTGIVTYAIRAVVNEARSGIADGEVPPGQDQLDEMIEKRVLSASGLTLRGVINATGVVLHTNLGRAVLGANVLKDIAGIVTGYSTIEYDTAHAKRGNRHDHVTGLLRYLTGAEDALVVNNNAAGIVLALSTLARPAKKREVIISRGELVEIGGEFRIPDIMAAAGAKMVEVGTTNRTRIADYEKVITEKTALIFKAHKSNYSMKGFVEEASLAQCAALAHKKGLPFVYDIGSGLIRKPASLPLGDEPDVAAAIAMGADLVLFSCDKLLGGPQAGVVAGRADLVARCGKAPLMRALRVGKLTMAAFLSSLRSFLSDASLKTNNPTFAMLSRARDEVRQSAERLAAELAKRGIACHVAVSSGQCGGGTLPDLAIPSFSVVIDFPFDKQKQRADAAGAVFKRLHAAERPVIGVLREGSLLFDMLTVQDSDITACALAIASAENDLRQPALRALRTP